MIASSLTLGTMKLNAKNQETSQERKLRDAINNGKVSWELYKVLKDLTDISVEEIIEISEEEEK